MSEALRTVAFTIIGGYLLEQGLKKFGVQPIVPNPFGP
ncbi:hypothetical protein DMTZ50_0319 [Dehalococcoides mccartyi]|nr:hypothetical protein [Dehalococcoides mccartyi]